LLLRVVLLLLFALALADVRWGDAASGSSGAADGTHLVLVLDGSYSMDFRQGGVSRFDLARSLAAERVRELAPGSGVSLVLMARPAQSVLGPPAFDAGAVVQEIAGLELTHQSADLAAALAEIETLLRHAAEQHPRLVNRHVCFFTDLQRATWGEAAAPAVRGELQRLASQATLELVDLGTASDVNLAVTSIRAEPGLLALGQESLLTAEVQNFSSEARPAQAVEVLVEGQKVAAEQVDLPAHGRASIAVAHRWLDAGDHEIEVRLAEDDLPLDNRRHLIVPVRDAEQVLMLGGRPGETRHLAAALAPRRGSAEAIRVVEASESRLLEGRLEEADCLVLANIGRFSREEAEALDRYVRAGGGLIVFLGDQVQAESYNARLAEPVRPLLPARLLETAATAQAPYAIDPLGYEHPLVAPFRGFERAGLLTTPVWKYVRAAPQARAAVALAFGSGDPAIVEWRVGRGRVILVTTAASPLSRDETTDPPTPWTALPEWPSFPPLVHEMLQLAVGGQGDARNVLVGETISLTAAPGQAEDEATVRGPEGQKTVAWFRTESELRWDDVARRQGVYDVRAGERTFRFAAQLDPREGDLTRLEPAALPREFSRQPASGPPPSAAASDSFSAFRWLLAVVGLLLIVEPWLAWLARKATE
jgi:hypothetical protein